MKTSEPELEFFRLATLARVAIEETMAARGLRRTDIANETGAAKSRITKILDGESNLTLRTLASLGLACGVRWEFVGVAANDANQIAYFPHSLQHAFAQYLVGSTLEAGWISEGNCHGDQSNHSGALALAGRSHHCPDTAHCDEPIGPLLASHSVPAELN